MSDLIAYKSNALVEASYKLTLQEQRFLLLCISRLKSGADAELQKTMTITAAEYFDSIGEQKHARDFEAAKEQCRIDNHGQNVNT